MNTNRFYMIFIRMHERCRNRNNKYYGGKGIKVCDEWKKFENFKSDMYPSYLKHCKEFGEKDTSIDRIDNNANYSPNNCKWSTHKEQSRNISVNVFITFKGKTQCMKDWAEELGIKDGTLGYRMRKKWPLKKALSKRLFRIYHLRKIK